MKHADEDPVMIGYSAFSNISFRGSDELGLTWGEWRGMSDKERYEEVTEYLYTLVDIYIKDDEEDDGSEN